MSDAANWSRVRELFSRALDLDPPLRAGFLRDACVGDSALHAEVSSLLAAHADAGSLAEGSPFDALDASAVASLHRGLRAGDRLGPYDIVGPLGAGGMGEVFEARDSLLGRRVAIKILSAELALDAAARDRFAREAKALAALNHPNIAAIYGVETTGASDARQTPTTALVLELVEGQTLADRVARGSLPIADVLILGAQIAGALEAAHENGIIHRDLKPANIKIRPDGTVKVLDFGLAKIRDQGSGLGDQWATGSIFATEAGIILGTPAYMSPEQVRGEDVDKRADMWALGCVLFELLTSRRAFGGGTASDCVAAVLEREPDWSALPNATPASIGTLLRRCLQKDQAKRLRDMGDARFALEDASLTTEQVAKAQPSKRSWILVTLLGATAAALAALAIPSLRPLREAPAPTLPEARVDIVTPDTNRPRSFALSPDGRQIVFVASGDGASMLWLRSLATTTAQPLAGTEGAVYPFWKPDSRSVGFFADGKLKRLDLGGASQALAQVVGGGQGGTWNADDVIVFAPNQRSGLMRVSATAGGAVSTLTTVGPQQRGHITPYFLPDGRRVLFRALVGDFTPDGRPGPSEIYLGSLDGGAPTHLTAANSNEVYLPSGWLLWVRTGTQTLVAQRLDTSKAELTGAPITVADGVDSVSVATTGVVAYRSAQEQRQLAWFDRSGTARGTVGALYNGLNDPRISPDGHNRVVITRIEQGGNTDIWLLDGSRPSRLTFDAAADTRPIWSPDGTRIAFSSSRTPPNDLYMKRANAAAPEEQVVASDQIKAPLSWSKDGYLMYGNFDPQTGYDLWVVPMFGDRTPSVFLRTPNRETQGMFSPNGRWVVYESDESGRSQIYVRPFVRPGATGSAAGGQVQVSIDGGKNPVWRPDGKEVYFLNPAGAMMAASIKVSGSTPEAGAPDLLFPTRIFGGGEELLQRRQYDVGPDGRFLINTELSAAPITLLMNWNPEMKK